MGPACLEQDEKAGEDDQESRQMVIEFTFLLVGQELALVRGVHLRLFVYGHRHRFVSGVG